MSVRFQPSKFGNQKAPDVQSYTPNATLAIERGAVVTYDVANDELDEHAGGATVTGILGVALCGCVAGTSDDPSGLVPVAKGKDQEFAGSVINTGTVVTDLSGISIGDQFGILKHTDNEWYVDQADITNVVLQITKVLDDLNLVLFRFLESALQEV